jgi:2-keto-4-pentenoate hydratase
MTTTIEQAADALIRARALRRPVPAVAPASADDAYAVQSAVARALGWFADGAPRHWKSGGPSRDAVLTHAPLPPAGVWRSPASSAGWPLQLHGIEAEIALRLAADVDAERAAQLGHAEAVSLIDAMTVSIEIVDSRWSEGLEAPALAKLADLQSHGALVLGRWVPFAARDWSAQRCSVRIGDGAPAEFRGTHALADPAFVLPAWLRHATRDGGVVPAGSVVTTGTWCGVLHARPGRRVQVEFDGIGAAEVEFAPAPAERAA